MPTKIRLCVYKVYMQHMSVLLAREMFVTCAIAMRATHRCHECADSPVFDCARFRYAMPSCQREYNASASGGDSAVRVRMCDNMRLNEEAA